MSLHGGIYGASQTEGNVRYQQLPCPTYPTRLLEESLLIIFINITSKSIKFTNVTKIYYYSWIYLPLYLI